MLEADESVILRRTRGCTEAKWQVVTTVSAKPFILRKKKQKFREMHVYGIMSDSESRRKLC